MENKEAWVVIMNVGPGLFMRLPHIFGTVGSAYKFALREAFYSGNRVKVINLCDYNRQYGEGV